MITLREACFMSAANGGTVLSDAVNYVIKNADRIIPKEAQNGELAALIESAKRYPANMSLADVAKMEKGSA